MTRVAARCVIKTARQKEAAAAAAAMTQGGSNKVKRRQSFERKVSTRTKRQAKALGDASTVSGCELQLVVARAPNRTCVIKL